MSRALAWLDRSPARGWWAPIGLAATLLAWGHGVLWATGALPAGARADFLLVAVGYGPYFVSVLMLTNAIAGRSLGVFWRATGWPETERGPWSERFRNSPSGSGPLLLVIGLVLTAGTVASGLDAIVPQLGGDRAVALLAVAPAALAGYGFLPFVFAHSIHQVRLVSRIHREATRIDPFDRDPIYAFSGLTGTTALLYGAAVYYSWAVNGIWQAGNVVGLGVLAAGILIGVALFLLPLWGIHERLVAAKSGLLHEAESRVTAVAAELYRRVDAGEFDATKAVADTFAAVVAGRDRIAQLPTWPWPPRLLRGLLSALLLPVVVYVVSRGVGSLLGT